MQEIFVIHAEQEEGPLTLPEVRRRVALGELAREDMAWTTGMARKVPLSVLLRTEGAVEEVKIRAAKVQAEQAPKSLWASTPGWVILVVALVAWVALRGVGEAILSNSSPTNYAAVAPLQKSSLGGLELEAPLVFKKVNIPLPPESLAVGVESYQAIGGNLQVLTAVAKFPPGSTIDVEAGMERVMHSMAEMVQAPLPEYTAERVEVGGWPARKVKVVFERRNTVSGEMEDYPGSFLFIGLGNELASVAIIEMRNNEEVAERARRIIDSVAVVRGVEVGTRNAEVGSEIVRP